MRPAEAARYSGADDGPVVIAGGCGFIGANLAARLLAEGERVVLIDDLSRPGVERNLAWLVSRHGDRIAHARTDIRDADAVKALIRPAKAVFHFAAQTAVTTSLVDPVADFDVNARGTLCILEAARRADRRPPVIFASTNKVYGCLEELALVARDGRHVPACNQLAEHGISELAKLDFATPYGCSKGVADQYVLDYAKSFGLATAVMRMSCIYGPRQFGTEDQGWVAHFLLRALRREPVVIYGDGHQVRDLLHVDDAVAAYLAVWRSIGDLSGQAFNLGGGPQNAVTLTGVLDEIAAVTGRSVAVSHEGWRQGDQPYFVADTAKLGRATGWSAETGWRDGLRDLAGWLTTLVDPAPAAEQRRIVA